MKLFIDLPLFGIPILSFITAGAGGYVGAFLRKKAENLVTKQDFKDLLTQTQELREATKRIDTKIEEQAWSRRRSADLRRDTLLAAMTALRGAQSAVDLLYSAYGADMKRKDAQANERILEQTKHCYELLAEFDEKRFAASLVCSKPVDLALTRPAALMRYCIIKAANGDYKKGSNLIPRLHDAVTLAIDFMRNDIDVPSLSNQSSEAPSLGLLARLRASESHKDQPPS